MAYLEQSHLRIVFNTVRWTRISTSIPNSSHILEHILLVWPHKLASTQIFPHCARNKNVSNAGSGTFMLCVKIFSNCSRTFLKHKYKCIIYFAKSSVEVTHSFKSRHWWLQRDLTKKWKSLDKFEWVKEMKNQRHWWHASRVPKATWQKNLLYIILFTSIQIMGKNVKAPITSHDLTV